MNDALYNLDSFRGSPCPACDGTGKEFDSSAIRSAITKCMRTKKLRQTSMASELEICDSYFSQLLNGSKHWTTELVTKLLKILNP